MADISNQISRLEKSIDKLADSINKGGGLRGGGNPFEDIEETAKKASDAIDRITKSITKDINALARQLPIIGDIMAKNIEKATRSLVSGIVGNTSVGGRVGLAAIAAAAAAVGNEFVKISKAQADLAKQTGLYGNQLTNIRQITTNVYQNNIKYGISMSDAANSAAALATSLGSTNRVTSDLVTLNATLAKYAGTSAQSMSELTSTLVRGFSMSSKEAENFTNIIANRAVSAGQNAAIIIRDMASNSNLLAMHSQRGADYIADMAKYSGAMGVGFEKMQKMSDIFINMETGAEMAQKINMWTGSTLNSQLLFNKALKGDTLGIFKDLNAAFSTPKGISMITKYPGAARQLAQQLGLSYNELRKIAIDGPEALKKMASQKEQQISIKEALREQYTFYQKIQLGLGQIFIPMLSKAGDMLYGMAKTLENMGFNENSTAGLLTAIGVISSVFAGKGLLNLLSRGTDLSPMVVRFQGGRTFPQGPGGVPYPSRFPDLETQQRETSNKKPQKWGGGGGKFGLAGAALGVGATTAGMAMGGMDGIDMVLSLISVVAPFFGLPGMAIGAGAGVLSLLKNLFIDKAATGRVVSSPSLFMVGEENKKEVIIPTERIRNGLPISPDVAAELSSIGVPGFSRGRVVISQNERLKHATQGGQAAYSGAASLAETRRRQQEISGVNREYQKKLDLQHDEITDLMKEQLRQERVLNSLTLGAINSPRKGAGLDGLTTLLEDMLDDFKESALTGVKQGYNIWKSSLTENQRKWVETGEATKDFINTWIQDGKKVALTQLMVNQKQSKAMDNILGAFIGNQRASYMGGGIRTFLYLNQAQGMNWQRSLAGGAATTFNTLSNQALLRALDPNYQDASGGGEVLPWLRRQPGRAWRAVRGTDRFNPLKGSLNISSGYTGSGSEFSSLTLSNDSIYSWTPNGEASTNINDWEPTTASREELRQMNQSEELRQMDQSQSSVNYGGIGAAAGYAGLGGFAQGLMMEGYNRQGVRTGLQMGASAAGDTLMTAGAGVTAANPVAGAALFAGGLALKIGSQFIGNIVPKSKSEARMQMLGKLQKIANGTRDIADFKMSALDIDKMTRGQSSKTRTLTGLMMLFGNRGLKMGEALRLLQFLLKSSSARKKSADRFFWNQRLFGVTAEQQELMDERDGTDSLGVYKELYGDKDFETVQKELAENDTSASKQYYEELLNRVNSEQGQSFNLNDYMNDGVIDEGKLINDIQQTNFDLESYMSSGLSDDQGSSGAGPGGSLQMPPEFFQVMNQLNYNIQQMSQEKTIQILIDGQALATAVVGDGNR